MRQSAWGTIVAAFGRHYEVALSDGRRVTGIPLGKKSPYAVGDVVELASEAGERVQILAHRPRTSLLYRSDAYRQKLIAANVTQIVLVVATEPAFYDELLSRVLVAAEDQGIRCLVALNKIDLHTKLDATRTKLSTLAALGYPVLELSAKFDIDPLLRQLHGETSVLVGQSGMGKSTLVNALVPDAAASTREISTALDSGKHTTTHARMYALKDGGHIIDSPGLQEFGLAHLGVGEIEAGFVEFRPYLGQCRFRNCRHGGEPGCAVLGAVHNGDISQARHRHFRALVDEIDKHPAVRSTPPQ